VTEEKQKFEDATYDFIEKTTGVKYDESDVWIIAENEYKNIAVPRELYSELKKNLTTCTLANEADRRTGITVMITNVLYSDTYRETLGYSNEAPVSVEHLVDNGRRKLKLGGRIDYVIYPKSGNVGTGVRPTSTHFVAVVAKNFTLTAKHQTQCIAEAAAIHKARKDAGKSNLKVWAVLTNGEIWRFIHIRQNGTATVSKNYFMQPLDPTLLPNDLVANVYKILHYVVMQAYEISPTTTPTQSNENITQ
jgi:hypothetical protein